jgi:hypothetical protein
MQLEIAFDIFQVKNIKNKFIDLNEIYNLYNKIKYGFLLSNGCKLLSDSNQNETVHSNNRYAYSEFVQ